MLVGLIDWDLAEPGPPLRDLASAALTSVPLRDDELAQRLGFTLQVDRRRRLAVLCKAFGRATSEELLTATIDWLALEKLRLRVFSMYWRRLARWIGANWRGRQSVVS